MVGNEEEGREVAGVIGSPVRPELYALLRLCVLLRLCPLGVSGKLVTQISEVSCFG